MNRGVTITADIVSTDTYEPCVMKLGHVPEKL